MWNVCWLIWPVTLFQNFSSRFYKVHNIVLLLQTHFNYFSFIFIINDFFSKIAIQLAIKNSGEPYNFQRRQFLERKAKRDTNKARQEAEIQSQLCLQQKQLELELEKTVRNFHLTFFQRKKPFWKLA